MGFEKDKKASILKALVSLKYPFWIGTHFMVHLKEHIKKKNGA
jgi:hypothetical protein